MSTPEAVFSMTERVVLVPSVKTGALLGRASSTSVILMVTLIESLPPLSSETVIVTE